GYTPSSNGARNYYNGNSAPISKVSDDDRNSYAPYKGYYQNNDNVKSHDDNVFRPPQRKYSLSPSLSSVGSNTSNNIPSRYQQDDKRSNNYL
ncbi:4514_t:CDS:1, partial [Scutellospora calospora]